MSMDAPLCSPKEILTFWFEELRPEHWFKPPPGLDQQCQRRFLATHLALARGIPPLWRETPDNRLAAIIVLDQLPRNIYRASPLAFATDNLALREAKLAIAAGADLAIPAERRCFFYMPFEHAENLSEQVLSVKLFTELADPNYLDFAIRHHEVIRLFGRFPHRNEIIGRTSTAAEEAYLSQPGAGF